MPIGNWKSDGEQGVLTCLSQVGPAQPKTTCCAGVLVNSSTIKNDGTTLAWVLRKKRTLDLSGLYNTSVNGVNIGKTAILQKGQVFIMARSHDDELDVLRSAFDELTGGTSTA